MHRVGGSVIGFQNGRFSWSKKGLAFLIIGVFLIGCVVFAFFRNEQKKAEFADFIKVEPASPVEELEINKFKNDLRTVVKSDGVISKDLMKVIGFTQVFFPEDAELTDLDIRFDLEPETQIYSTVQYRIYEGDFQSVKKLVGQSLENDEWKVKSQETKYHEARDSSFSSYTILASTDEEVSFERGKERFWLQFSENEGGGSLRVTMSYTTGFDNEKEKSVFLSKYHRYVMENIFESKTEIESVDIFVLRNIWFEIQVRHVFPKSDMNIDCHSQLVTMLEENTDIETYMTDETFGKHLSHVSGMDKDVRLFATEFEAYASINTDMCLIVQTLTVKSRDNRGRSTYEPVTVAS